MARSWHTCIPAEPLNDFLTASQTLGSDPSLVLGGGGNSSIKTTFTDITGQRISLLVIKASGHDLSTLSVDGLSPLRLDQVRRLLPPTDVPNADLQNELRCALVDSNAPDPSVETLIHALLPSAVVLHSHADAILSLSNSPDGPQMLRSLLPDCIMVDYAMPGPELVSACQQAWQSASAGKIGLVVLGHGLFTFGDTAKQALSRHLDIVARAQQALGPDPTPIPTRELAHPAPVELSALRHSWCLYAGKALIVRRSSDDAVRVFVSDPHLLDASQQGPLTPDHATWTKRVPLVGDDLHAYQQDYERYFEVNQRRYDDPITPLDPAPRVLLDPRLGMLTVGRTPLEAATTAEIYQHTMMAIQRADRMGGWSPASPEHVFDLEYWPYQQAKTSRRIAFEPLQGQIALVTGVASGIGRGCAAALLDAGAVVIGWDISASVADTFDSPNFMGLKVDVTDSSAMTQALATQVEMFGGLDILVVSAGVFPTSANLGQLTVSDWRRTMSINVDSVMELYTLAHPLLAHGFPYGRVVLIASKNVAAPGPGAAAYSSSKAAVTQLTRVAALEWAGEGIRVNMLHPDAVFDTGLWTPELLEARAQHYGMSVDAYKRRNLLHTEITSARVGQLALALCSDAFAATTGAQVSIDGGNERTI